RLEIRVVVAAAVCPAGAAPWLPGTASSVWPPGRPCVARPGFLLPHESDPPQDRSRPTAAAALPAPSRRGCPFPPGPLSAPPPPFAVPPSPPPAVSPKESFHLTNGYHFGGGLDLFRKEALPPAWVAPLFRLYTSSKGNYFFEEIRDLVAAGMEELGCRVLLNN